ncbi:2TM domain-containing protein [Flavobacterium sp.]|jgi:uncharacterized protein YacL|uniref:2TM domain-containing protein n=1 Tax=Flavobacterium sp. TaxID=239 RepID=UPI0037C02965
MEVIMENMESQKSPEESVRERVKKLSQFYTHLFIYVIGIIIYVLKTYFGVQFNFLPIKYINGFVMCFWTFFLVVQGLKLFLAERVFGTNWEQKQIRKMMNKQNETKQKWE